MRFIFRNASSCFRPTTNARVWHIVSFVEHIGNTFKKGVAFRQRIFVSAPATRRICRGFTLIELAIVLFIIGIVIAGAVVTGSSVMGRARVASLLTNIKDLATASRDFKARYGYFPGDLPSASSYIPAIAPGDPCNVAVTAAVGIGNGLVDTAAERNCALNHLVAANMLTKLDYETANSRYVINSRIALGVQVSLWFNAATNENVIRIANLPCDVALEIDRKFDSTTTGNPPSPFSAGSVRAQDATNTAIPNCIPRGAVGGPSNDPVPWVFLKY